VLSEFVKAAKTGDIPDGTTMSVTVEGEQILIACIGGQDYAIHNKCSHQGGWLDQGELLTDSCEVMCPVHDACFDLRTGEPTAEPAKTPVKVYAVRVEGDDILLGPAGS
jgi:nitrite reductase/ring-hydroxylating ferredoxin subunit